VKIDEFFVRLCVGAGSVQNRQYVLFKHIHVVRTGKQNILLEEIQFSFLMNHNVQRFTRTFFRKFFLIYIFLVISSKSID